MDASASPSSGGCFLRILYFLICPGLLFVTSCLLLVEGKGWFGPIDVAHVCVAALALAARSLDRADAEPSKAKYARAVIGIAAALWAGAHGVRILMQP
ncbi:MAG: hypothetical protein AAB434_10980 [Planctomycetota bacterium]